MDRYNIEQIEKLRIHELRDYARAVGISSPTTLKKNELIERIENVFGKEKTHNKHIQKIEDVDFYSLLVSDNSNLLNQLLDNALCKGKKTKDSDEKVDTPTKTIIMKRPVQTKDTDPYPTMQGAVGFNLSIKQNEAEYSDSIENITGYLDIHSSGYGIVRYNGYIPNNDDVYMTESLIKKIGLRKGDKVTGKVKTIIVGKPKIMYEVTTFDRVNAKLKFNYEDIPFSKIGGNLHLEENKDTVRQGERIYYSSMSIDKVIDLANELTVENSCYTKVINFKARPECDYKSNQKMEVINCPFNTPEIDSLNTIELVVERAKREFEMGKSTVIFLYNFSEIVRAFNVAIEGFYDFNKISAKAVNKIVNILYSAKNTNNGYISVICVDRDGVTKDIEQIMKLEFEPLFNTIN